MKKLKPSFNKAHHSERFLMKTRFLRFLHRAQNLSFNNSATSYHHHELPKMKISLTNIQNALISLYRLLRVYAARVMKIVIVHYNIFLFYLMYLQRLKAKAHYSDAIYMEVGKGETAKRNFTKYASAYLQVNGHADYVLLFNSSFTQKVFQFSKKFSRKRLTWSVCRLASSFLFTARQKNYKHRIIKLKQIKNLLYSKLQFFIFFFFTTEGRCKKGYSTRALWLVVVTPSVEFSKLPNLSTVISNYLNIIYYEIRILKTSTVVDVPLAYADSE